jgi:phospholipid/cholesterol/gamma-HCH transport system substrate-binding protein
MLTWGIRLKNVAFVLITVLVLGYVGVRFADLGRYVGMRDYYVVKADLPQTGGLFTNANITYRGVSVGRVGPIRLTGDGVEAELRIRDSAPRIPADLKAVVANLSAVGEQYIDLRPNSDSGPYLASGSRIARQQTEIPAPVTDLLQNLNDFTASVPLESLRTVVDEMGKAFAGQGENLQVLLDTGSEFLETADLHAPVTNQLIEDGETVLTTQSQEASALLTFARSARLLADQFGRSDADLRRLISAGGPAATQFSALLRDLDPSLSVLIANLLTTADVAYTRVDGTRQLMVRLPQVVAAGSTTITPRGATFGLGLTFFSPLPCTRGYEGTVYRNGLDTSRGPALNVAARCDMPASSGVNVRGPQNVPGAGYVPAPARPGSFNAGEASLDPALPGALALPALPDGPYDMSRLLGLGAP